MLHFLKKPKNVLDRKSKSLIELEKIGFKFHSDLPIIQLDEKTALKSAQDISNRAYILYVLSLVANNEVEADEAAVYFEAYSIFFHLTPKEISFLKNPTLELKNAYTWRVECIYIFLWALGKVDQVVAPNSLCDQNVIKDVFFYEGLLMSPNRFVSKSKTMRSKEEILDMIDLYLRINWKCIETKLDGQVLKLVNQKVVFERLYALQWITNHHMIWDDMPTDGLSWGNLEQQKGLISKNI